MKNPQIFCFAFAAEEEVAVFFGVGVEEFEGGVHGIEAIIV